jgi:hypothetical protein
MDPTELLDIIRQARRDLSRLERIKDVLDVLLHDAHLVRHAHDTFLPAARDYLRNRAAADYRLKHARIRRARLGGASRWLYHHQQQTFEALLHLLCPVQIPQSLLDQIWQAFKSAEIGLLSRSRDRRK